MRDTWPNLESSLSAAPALLGWLLVHTSPEGTTSGYVVETECYNAEDAASHSFKGKTPRTEVMFGPAGYLYVYFTYGMHYCVNIVTGPEGSGQAVLIRALQPVDGLDIMRKRRGNVADTQLTNGPAKLTQAMAINKAHNGAYVLGNGEFKLLSGLKPHTVRQTTRIGITKEIDKPWRFYIAGNPYVSRT